MLRHCPSPLGGMQGTRDDAAVSIGVRPQMFLLSSSRAVATLAIVRSSVPACLTLSATGGITGIHYSPLTNHLHHESERGATHI